MRSDVIMYSVNKTTDKDLKKYLKDIKIEASQVDDELFQEYWDRTAGIKDELTDAVDKLKDATCMMVLMNWMMLLQML